MLMIMIFVDERPSNDSKATYTYIVNTYVCNVLCNNCYVCMEKFHAQQNE